MSDTQTRPVNVGVIGCGNISGIYLKRMCETFEALDVVACADLDLERAEQAAEAYEGVRAMAPAELLADESIEVVVNLTTPGVHFEVAAAAVNAGKSVYNEKPLTLTRDEGRALLEAAEKAGVLVGGAPDTFLGAGLQTCRKLIDDGWIGRPVAATAFMTCRGHESWHPAPEFYYKPGGGPMLDMGPYYLTALVSLVGPVERVTGSTRKTFDTRLITSQPKCGAVIDVEVATHVAGVIDFADGAVGTIVTSFDVWSANLPRIEIYGTDGSLSVPDPNTFGGPVKVRRGGADCWSEVPLTHGYADNSRGLGVADLARAIRTGRPARAGGELPYHVLDVMHAFEDASTSHRHVKIASTCRRPAPLPMGLRDGEID